MAIITETWISQVVFTMISAAAFLGNSLVLGVYARKWRRRTITSFDVFIINLAVSDWLGAVFLIFSRFLYLPDMPGSQPPAHIFCTILWGGYILFGLGYVSVYTCLALTIERWIAVVKPHVYRRVKTKHVATTLLSVWLWAFLINTTVFISVDENFKEGKCEWVEPKIGKKFFPIMELCFSCVIPFTIIIVLYCHIIYKIRSGHIGNIVQQPQTEIKKRITVIALAASVALILGWLPAKISFTLRYTSIGRKHLHGTLHFIFIMLALSNIFVNPILYGIYSSKFRGEYKEVISKMLCPRCCSQTKETMQDENISLNE